MTMAHIYWDQECPDGQCILLPILRLKVQMLRCEMFSHYQPAVLDRSRNPNITYDRYTTAIEVGIKRLVCIAIYLRVLGLELVYPYRHQGSFELQFLHHLQRLTGATDSGFWFYFRGGSSSESSVTEIDAVNASGGDEWRGRAIQQCRRPLAWRCTTATFSKLLGDVVPLAEHHRVRPAAAYPGFSSEALSVEAVVFAADRFWEFEGLGWIAAASNRGGSTSSVCLSIVMMAVYHSAFRNDQKFARLLEGFAVVEVGVSKYTSKATGEGGEVTEGGGRSGGRTDKREVDGCEYVGGSEVFGSGTGGKEGVEGRSNMIRGIFRGVKKVTKGKWVEEKLVNTIRVVWKEGDKGKGEVSEGEGKGTDTRISGEVEQGEVEK
ncbi:hypothetical protein BJ138DRAFT_1184543 [Hygrophoropsis aurantiaca]|uniref:Uncharacterized protein n=1 Tax=Hygrophoropsis aurantiaca TaxID=72124 RepID=A0ACB7ZPX9_9AGAM|nr:hypothetical protein BJ138DRAFT_1184543 [Hygrophoropsis aurantiaca]